MTNITLTVPEGRTPSGVVCTERGVHPVVNGQVTVDIRDVKALLDAGFTNDDIPDLNNVSGQTTITLEAPDGFSGVVIADGVAYPVVSGEVTLPRKFLRSLALAGYSLPNGTEPLFVSDFKNGVYMEGGAAVTLSDIWTEDMVNFGPFPEENIVPGVGLTDDGNGTAPVLVEELVSSVVGNCTVVIQTAWGEGATGGEFRLHHVPIPEQNEDLEFIYRTVGEGIVSVLQSFEYGGNVEVPQTMTPNRFAITVTDDRMAASVNGGAALNFELVKVAEPNTIFVELADHLVVEYIAFYPPQDDGDLPTLSALE